MGDFKDPKTGLSSAYATYQRNGGKLKDVKNELVKQVGYQLNKQNKPRRHYFPIIGDGPGSWQIDLMEYNPSYHGFKIILCCVNVNTRYAYCYAFKKKSETNIFVKQFLEDAEKDKRLVKYIQSDNGSEFLNYKVKPIFKEYDIEHSTVNVGDHRGQGIVERFNQTIRRLITLYINSNDNNNWVEAFPDLVYNYNHRYHSALGTSPIDTNELIAVHQKVDQAKLAQIDYDKIKVGDIVRVLKNKGEFDKGRLLWSTKVYKVDEKVGNLIKLDNGLKYKHYEVQVVNGSDAGNDHEKIEKEHKKRHKIIRALNKEGIIGDGDTVQFTTREKRERAKDTYVGRTFRRKYGKKIYEGKVVKYLPKDGDDEEGWEIKYNEPIKHKNIDGGHGTKEIILSKEELKSGLVE